MLCSGVPPHPQLGPSGCNPLLMPVAALRPHGVWRVQVAPGMSVPAFLAAAEPLIMPLDAYFEKVFVMCEDEVSGWVPPGGVVV